MTEPVRAVQEKKLKQGVLRWENFSSVYGESALPKAPVLSRARVPGGWFVREFHAGTESSFPEGIALSPPVVSFIFLPDPEHTWELEEYDQEKAKAEAAEAKAEAKAKAETAAKLQAAKAEAEAEAEAAARSRGLSRSQPSQNKGSVHISRS